MYANCLLYILFDVKTISSFTHGQFLFPIYTLGKIIMYKTKKQQNKPKPNFLKTKLHKRKMIINLQITWILNCGAWSTVKQLKMHILTIPYAQIPMFMLKQHIVQSYL